MMGPWTREQAASEPRAPFWPRSYTTDMHEDESAEKALSATTIALLVENHREFLRYVERRVGSRALAEEIVQDAFVRSLDRGNDIRESAVGWFYRVLRNAVIDHQRRRAVADKRLDQLAAELQAEAAPSEDLARAACRCVSMLADSLKPEYADALRRVDVDGVAVKDYADSVGISANNAGVRVFRAREALKKQVARSCGTCAEHGCLDCTCDGSPKNPPGG
jgi:RNA polymerase sigma factor (sigma-70 family)